LSPRSDGSTRAHAPRSRRSAAICRRLTGYPAIGMMLSRSSRRPASRARRLGDAPPGSKAPRRSCPKTEPRNYRPAVATVPPSGWRRGLRSPRLQSWRAWVSVAAS
jgi:hypothetical protein